MLFGNHPPYTMAAHFPAVTINIITALNGWIEKCATTELTLLLTMMANIHSKGFATNITKYFLFCHKDWVEERVVVRVEVLVVVMVVLVDGTGTTWYAISVITIILPIGVGIMFHNDNCRPKIESSFYTL